MKRSGFLRRAGPLRTYAPLVRKTRINPINIPASKKRSARRAKERRNPEHKDARNLAWERANGICECGCQRPFDAMLCDPGYPEFHHTNYKKGHVAGVYLRRDCHQRIEQIHFSYRAARRKAMA